MNSLVSIVIPVYNVDKYLEETLYSIMNQSYDNIEIFLVDDGSTDKSSYICQKYESLDKRFHYLYQKNSGAPTARNLGLKQCSGDYILLFDSDDILNEDSIFLMVDKIKRDNSDVVIGNYTILNNGIEKQRYDDLLKTVKSINDLYFISPFPNNKLYTAELIKNITFDNVKIAQDANFFYKVIPYIKKYSLINNNICKYRILENSISNVCDSRILDVLKSLDYVEKFYLSNNISNEYQIVLNKAKIKHIINQVYKIVHSSKNDDTNYYLKVLNKSLNSTFYNILTHITFVQIKDYIYYIFLRLNYILKKNRSEKF